MLSFGVITALERTVREGAVPAKFLRTNLRAVESHGDALLQKFEMIMADVGLGGFASPAAAGAGIGNGIKQVVLMFAWKVTERCIVTAHALAVEIAEAVQERALCVGSFGRENEIDVTIYESFFGARSVSCGNN